MEYWHKEILTFAGKDLLVQACLHTMIIRPQDLAMLRFFLKILNMRLRSLTRILGEHLLNLFLRGDRTMMVMEYPWLIPMLM